MPYTDNSDNNTPRVTAVLAALAVFAAAVVALIIARGWCPRCVKNMMSGDPCGALVLK